ncbi:unnamed protein product [Echinostoma caproni]|uniref:Uncharacterized protein n=1 Tax=Echinostoma caproni TaxID=27848 RepID=A0A3P8ICF5_9TREM|nr:unnamed protein product [Echinostoma caproni]
MITNVYCDDEKDAKNMTYLYFQMPNTMPIKDQLSQRTGFLPGTIGSRLLPVIWPPTGKMAPVSPITLYRSNRVQSQTVEDYCQSKEVLDFSQVTEFIHWFIRQKLKARLVASKSNDLNEKFIRPFIATVPTARSEFVTFYCMLRKTPQVSLTAKNQLKITLTSQSDLYRFCPSPCASREGPGMGSAERAQLTRFTKPCSYPANNFPFISRKCTEEGQAIWREQLKTCQIRLYMEDHVATLGKSKDPELYRAAKLGLVKVVDCVREGTQYIGGVSWDSDSSGEEVIRSSHQALRCVCKPQYYGTRCDKVEIFL